MPGGGGLRCVRRSDRSGPCCHLPALITIVTTNIQNRIISSYLSTLSKHLHIQGNNIQMYNLSCYQGHATPTIIQVSKCISIYYKSLHLCSIRVNTVEQDLYLSRANITAPEPLTLKVAEEEVT